VSFGQRQANRVHPPAAAESPGLRGKITVNGPGQNASISALGQTQASLA
jgi:hypothetical protein